MPANRVATLTTALLLGLVTPVPATTQQPIDPARVVQRAATGALEMLRARDVSDLTPSQRAKRAWVVAELERYRDAGVFPENRDFPGDNVPYFIDRVSGAICAVGHLMRESGHGDLAERIAAEDNNVWVLELAADQEVGAWLDEHGLTLSEAARIQAPYIGTPPGDGPSESASLPPVRVGAVAALATTGALLNAFAKPGHESRLRVALGVSSGLLALYGGVTARDQESTRALGTLTLAMGGAALLSATKTYAGLRQNERMRLAPIIPMSRDEGAGISLSLTF